MPNTQLNNSDYIKFYIVAENNSTIEVKNLIGWREYGRDCARNLDYHGTLTEVTETFGFKNEAKQYILDEYNRNGVLANISMIVSRLVDKNINGSIETFWKNDEPVYADLYELELKEGILYIPFNSNSLMSKIDAYENEEFEIERLETYDNKTIEPMVDRFVELKGRSILNTGESYFEVLDEIYSYFVNIRDTVFYGFVIKTNVVSQGPERHSSQEQNILKLGNLLGPDLNAGYMFYVNSTEEEPDRNLDIKINIPKAWIHSDKETHLSIIKFVYNESSANFDEVQEYQLLQIPGIPGFLGSTSNEQSFIEDINLSLNVDLKWNEALSFGLFSRIDNSIMQFKCERSSINISEVEYFESSPSLRFHFFNDVIDRLMYIITGQKNKFISSWLGRKELNYPEDGEGALLGIISGFQARDFDKDSEKYKSPKFSLKDSIDSISNCFCLGAGVETINNKEVLVVEEIDYFYRNKVIGRFPYQISDQSIVVDKDSFFSSIKVGYNKGGDYDNEMGLDEPNIKSSFITPIDNSVNSFNKISSIRADEYGLEDLRRKKQISYPNESFSGDEDNWFLDLKRDENIENQFTQVDWSDRLDELPSGIHSPETFRSMLFSPLRMFFRLSKIFNSGLYKYTNKFVNFTSSSSNRNLTMKFKGEESYREGDNVQISKLKTPLFKNEKITFSHPYSEELREMLFGKTKVVIKGVERLVPNFFFKFEFVSEEGELLEGYFLKYTYSDKPVFEFQLSNKDLVNKKTRNEYNNDYSNDYNN